MRIAIVGADGVGRALGAALRAKGHAIVYGIPEVISGGHAGLLDVLISRDFESSHRIYLSYTHGAPGEISMRVMSAVLGESELTNQTVIFDSRPAQPGYDQIGGRLEVDTD